MICAIGAVGRFRVCAGLVEHAFAYDVPTIMGLIGTTVALNYFMNCFEDLPGSIFFRMSVGASGGPQNAKKERKKKVVLFELDSILPLPERLESSGW